MNKGISEILGFVYHFLGRKAENVNEFAIIKPMHREQHFLLVLIRVLNAIDGIRNKFIRISSISE